MRHREIKQFVKQGHTHRNPTPEAMPIVKTVVYCLPSCGSHLLIFIYVISEKAMAPHSNILAWQIPWLEKPGGLQFMESLRVGHN